jgi:hypothetical protein
MIISLYVTMSNTSYQGRVHPVFFNELILDSLRSSIILSVASQPTIKKKISLSHPFSSTGIVKQSIGQSI